MGFFEGLLEGLDKVGEAIAQRQEQLVREREAKEDTTYIRYISAWEQKWARGDKPEFFRMLEPANPQPQATTLADWEAFCKQKRKLAQKGDKDGIL